MAFDYMVGFETAGFESWSSSIPVEWLHRRNATCYRSVLLLDVKVICQR